jgi:hypothetical protein
MSAKQDLQVSEPDLKDALALLKKEIMIELHTKHVAVIEDFNPITQTATVSIAYKRTFFEPNGKGGLKSTLVPFPKIAGVPCIFPGGGAGRLTFPIAEGDECLLFINDRDIDRWFATGNTDAGCNTLRTHSITDAFALVGIRSTPKVLPNFLVDRAALGYDSNGTKTVYAGDSASGLEQGNFKVIADENYARIENGDTVVGVGGGKVKFQNANYTLKTELTTLITQLETLCTQLDSLKNATKAITVTPGSLAGPSSPPLNAAAFTPIGTAIGNVKTAIGDVKTHLGDLLE